MSLRAHTNATISRRDALRIAVAAGVVGWSREGRAADGVPVEMQLELLQKVVGYDRNMKRRLDGEFVIRVVRADTAAAEGIAAGVKKLLGRIDRIMDLPLRVQVAVYADEAALLAELDEARPAVLLFIPGLGSRITDIAEVLDGRDLLSVSLDPEDVGQGAVLGFELIESRPRIVIDLRQAQREGVTFNARLLQLARVIR